MWVTEMIQQGFADTSYKPKSRIQIPCGYLELEVILIVMHIYFSLQMFVYISNLGKKIQPKLL